MQRKEITALIRKGCDASCIGNKRMMARRAKRQGAKKLRQKLRNHIK